MNRRKWNLYLVVSFIGFAQGAFAKVDGQKDGFLMAGPENASFLFHKKHGRS